MSEKLVSVKVVATKLTYYDHQRRYPAESGHKLAGQAFSVRVPLGKDGKPVLGSWLKLAEEESKHERQKTQKEETEALL